MKKMGYCVNYLCINIELETITIDSDLLYNLQFTLVNYVYQNILKGLKIYESLV